MAVVVFAVVIVVVDDSVAVGKACFAAEFAVAVATAAVVLLVLYHSFGGPAPFRSANGLPFDRRSRHRLGSVQRQCIHQLLPEHRTPLASHSVAWQLQIDRYEQNSEQLHGFHGLAELFDFHE